MTEIKTAAAWGSCMTDGQLYSSTHYKQSDAIDELYQGETVVPVTIVHGASESDILAGLSLLAKSREVCEWREHNANNMSSYTPVDCGGNLQYDLEKPNFCQSCGLRVEVKE